MSFESDIQGQNTQLYPIVVIERGEESDGLTITPDYIFLSTNNVNIDLVSSDTGLISNPTVHCKPLLLNIPSIKESVDVESRKFKISNVSLDISNYEYEGERFTDILSETSLINTPVSIYFKSPSTTWVSSSEDIADNFKYNLCPLVYQGIIRRLSHDDEKVKVELEDLTEKKAHKDLPLADTYIQTESVPDKYKNKPTPIVYGEVDRSPVALDVDLDGDIILLADSKDIFGLNEDSPLYIHKADTFLNAPMDAISPKTGEPMFRWIKNEEYDSSDDSSSEYTTRYSTGVQYSLNGNTITLNGDFSDTEEESGNSTGNAIGDNKIVVSQIAYPNVINAIRKKIDNQNSYYSVKHDYNSVNDDFVAGDEVEHNNLPLIIRGVIYRESVNSPWDDWQQQIDSNDITAEAMWETENELDVDGEDFQKGKSGCIVKLPIIEGIGKQDDDTKLSGSLGYVYADISAGFFERELFDSINIDIDFRIGGHKYQDHNGDVGMKKIYALGANEVGEFNNDFDYSGGSGAFVGINNASDDDGAVYNSISGNDDTTIVHKSSSLLLYTRFNNNTTNGGLCFVQMQIKDLYVNQLDLVDNLLSQSFYANVSGRVNTFDDHPSLINITAGSMSEDYETFSQLVAIIEENESNLDADIYNEVIELIEAYISIGSEVSLVWTLLNWIESHIGGSFIQNPIDIIYDLVRSEIGHENIDEAEYEEAKLAHSDWKFGFTVNKKISSKKLIEEIAKSTKCFPKFKNDGSFGFNTVKDSYTYEGDGSDYTGATPIKESEVISYSFKKTKPEQIYQKVDVQYNKDYAQDSYLKRTNPYLVTSVSESIIDQIGFDNMQTTNVIGGNPAYYGIDLAFNGQSDAYLEFESDYIRNEETADKLALFLREQYKNDHLIFNLKLPLQYIDLEIGDLVKFETLFQGVKAYGIDYRILDDINFQKRYPLFMVTSTQKNLDSVSIECMQLHHLDILTTPVDWNDLNNSFPDSDTVTIEPYSFAADVVTTEFQETDDSVETDNLYIHRQPAGQFVPSDIYWLYNKDLEGFDFTEYDGGIGEQNIFLLYNKIQIKNSTDAIIVNINGVYNTENYIGAQRLRIFRTDYLSNPLTPEEESEFFESFFKPEGWEEGDVLPTLEITRVTQAAITPLSEVFDDKVKDLSKIKDIVIW